jgi:RNA polymerase sigma-70 factor (ECF subfamily)
VDEQGRREWVASHILPHEGEVRAWLRRHVHRLTSSDIDDLIQDAYARLCDVDVTRIAHGRAYLFAVLRNLLVEHARRARIVPMERLGEIEALRVPSDEPGPDRRVTAQQELERLEQIVAGLPEQCRRTFQLQKFHSLSQREIALEMNITEKTVEKHLAVALVRVLNGMKEEDVSTARRSQSGISDHESEQSGH